MIEGGMTKRRSRPTTYQYQSKYPSPNLPSDAAIKTPTPHSDILTDNPQTSRYLGDSMRDSTQEGVFLLEQFEAGHHSSAIAASAFVFVDVHSLLPMFANQPRVRSIPNGLPKPESVIPGENRPILQNRNWLGILQRFYFGDFTSRAWVSGNCYK